MILKGNVLITPFKNKVIPPPMSLFKLACPKPINCLVWSHTNMNIMAYLSSGELLLFNYKKIHGNKSFSVEFFINIRLIYIILDDQKSKFPFKYELVGQTRIEIKGLKNYNVSVNNMLWINDNELLVIADTEFGFKLVSFELDTTNQVSLAYK
jgi:hypothetical protein